MRGTVGVGRREHLRGGRGHAGQELREERLGEDGDLVGVHVQDRHASDRRLCLGVGCADDVDAAAEYRDGRRAVVPDALRRDGPEKFGGLQGADHVAPDRLAGTADDDDFPDTVGGVDREDEPQE